MISLRKSSLLLNSLVRKRAQISAVTVRDAVPSSRSVSTLLVEYSSSFSSSDRHRQRRQRRPQQVRNHRTATSSRRRARARANANAIRYPKQRVPTLDTALSMPLEPCEMDNAMLVTLGALGSYQARKEILKRHIMCRDRVSYQQACATFRRIELKNKEYVFLLSLPYHVGIGAALCAGGLALPMVFNLPVAEWFNQHYVTTEIPEPEDLETMLEVGSWTWNWMEVRKPLSARGCLGSSLTVTSAISFKAAAGDRQLRPAGAAVLPRADPEPRDKAVHCKNKAVAGRPPRPFLSPVRRAHPGRVQQELVLPVEWLTIVG